MTDPKRMLSFLDSLDSGNIPFLEQLYEEAAAQEVPVIRRQTQSFIRVLLSMIRPKAVLEVGTAIGFSSVLFCTYSDAAVTTIENYEKRIPAAKANFRRAGVEERVTLLEGDAAKILPELHASYDLIFMDAAKGQYLKFYPDVKRLLKDGGVLLSDNVLQEDRILESHFAVMRRDRTIHKRVRSYLRVISTDPDMMTTILPIGDGLAVSVKQPEKENV
jgi:predicted O-methyltransferase YrrM